MGLFWNQNGLKWNHNHELCHITIFRRPKCLFWSYFVSIMAKFYRKFGISESSQFKFARNRPVLTWMTSSACKSAWIDDVTIFHFRSNWKILIKKWFIFFLRAYSSDEKVTNSFEFAIFRALLRPPSPQMTTLNDHWWRHGDSLPLEIGFFIPRLILTRESLIWDIYYFWDYPREWMLLDWLYLCGVLSPSGQVISSRPRSEPIWPDHVTFSKSFRFFPPVKIDR